MSKKGVSFADNLPNPAEISPPVTLVFTPEVLL